MVADNSQTFIQIQRARLSESIFRDSSKSRSNWSSASFFSAHILSKFAKKQCQGLHILRRLLVQVVDLVIRFFICLVRLAQTALLPRRLSRIHQRSSEVTFRYLSCILDFFHPPLSVLSTLSLVLDAASEVKELEARPSQSRPPLSEVGMILQLVWYQDGYLRQFSFRWTSGIPRSEYVRTCEKMELQRANARQFKTTNKSSDNQPTANHAISFTRRPVLFDPGSRSNNQTNRKQNNDLNRTQCRLTIIRRNREQQFHECLQSTRTHPSTLPGPPS